MSKASDFDTAARVDSSLAEIAIPPTPALIDAPSTLARVSPLTWLSAARPEAL